MAVAVYSTAGVKSATTAKLPSEVFAVEIKNHQLLKDAYLAYLANGRVNLAKTLNRGDVSGGGIKPWRQKGTGRARFGSSRNPIWRGGGVAFGPQGNENYHRELSAKSKRQALCQALTLAAKDKNVLVIEDFVIKDGKTKLAVSLLNKLGATRRTIIVASDITGPTALALRNVPEVKLVLARKLNVFDVMNADYLILNKQVIDELKSRLGGEK